MLNWGNVRLRAATRHSHSFTLVYRGVIPVGSSLVVGLGYLAAESHRVSSCRCLGQTLRQIRKLLMARGRAVSFLSRGQKRTNARTLKRTNGSNDRQIRRLGAHCEKRIVASGFASSYFRRSQLVQIIHERRNRHRRLCSCRCMRFVGRMFESRQLAVLSPFVAFFIGCDGSWRYHPGLVIREIELRLRFGFRRLTQLGGRSARARCA